MNAVLHGCNTVLTIKIDTLLEDCGRYARRQDTPAMNETHPLSPQEPDAFKPWVLEQLRAAGAAGIASSKLVDTKKAALKAERLAQLADLLASGGIQEQRKGKVVRYWLEPFTTSDASQEQKG